MVSKQPLYFAEVILIYSLIKGFIEDWSYAKTNGLSRLHYYVYYVVYKGIEKAHIDMICLSEIEI